MLFSVIASFFLIAPTCFVQQYLVSHCIGCPPIQTFSSFPFGVSFLYCSVTMLCQYCVVWVVWNVLRTSCCSYVSSFLHVQGSAFQFQCMYAPPHPVKKCVVLCVRGLLCFVDPSLGPSSPDAPFQNIFLRLDVPKLFAMLLDKFHVGLWSSMTKLKLFPLLRHILPPAVMKTLLFIFSREDCCDFKNYPSCYKMCDTLFRKPASRVVCTENQVLFVDVCPVSMRHNADAICYLPFPFLGEFHYPNESRAIPNVATDIIPFIFPLYRFPSVPKYMVHAVRPGQRNCYYEDRIQCSRRMSLRH